MAGIWPVKEPERSPVPGGIGGSGAARRGAARRGSGAARRGAARRGSGAAGLGPQPTRQPRHARSLALVDVVGVIASNDDVTHHARDATTDVIASGREPSARPRRWGGAPGRTVRVLVIAQTAVLIGSVAMALHYRAAASGSNHSRPSATSRSRPPSLPQLVSAKVSATG